MKILVKPPEPKKTKNGKKKRVTLKMGNANTALEFRLNEITAHSFDKKFTLELVEKNGDHVEMICTDGLRKQHRLQYFNAKRNVSCCSCDEFVTDECRFCVHLAAVENALKYSTIYSKDNPDYSRWAATFRMRLVQLPTSIKKFQQHYTFFDPYSSNYYTFGKTMPTVETVSTKTFRKLEKKKTAQKVKYLPKKIDDTGLLDGVILFNYQKDVFRNMITAQRAICSMVMGAGKTLTTIACYSFIDKHKPGGGATMLVVAPKSLRKQWGAEIERTCHVPVFQIEKPADIQKSTEYDVNIVTYQFITRHIDKFKTRNWDIIVVDEIQYVRNSATKTWRAISKLKSDFFFGLSGTVIENRLDDLYSIMEIINPGVLGPKWKFDDKFQELHLKSKAKWIYKGFKNLNDLKTLLQDCVFSYDKLKLPPIQHNNIFVLASKEQQTMHDGFWEEAKILIAKSLNGPVSNKERMMVQALLLKARQVGNSIELITKKPEKPSQKVERFLELVEDACIKNNKKLVVFSDWVEMLEMCARHAQKKFGISPVYFTGKQNLDQRQAAVRTFQTDPKALIFFASDAGGIGLDGLQQVSSEVIHLELPWNPAKLDQRSARVHRIGQQNPVTIHYLITKNTLEEHIFSLIQEKKNVRLQTLASFHV